MEGILPRSTGWRDSIPRWSTGGRPFEAASGPDLFRRVQEEEIERPSKLDPTIEAPLERVVLQGMARRPVSTGASEPAAT